VQSNNALFLFTMANSDQLEEIEALSSIYPTEFEILPPLVTDESKKNLAHFKVHLIPGNVDEKVHGILYKT